MSLNDNPAAPPIIANLPPPDRKPSSGRKAIAVLLSVFLGLFLTGGLVSMLDDSCVLLFGNHLFDTVAGILTLLVLVTSFIVYLLMALTPLIPKRIVLPIMFMLAVIFLGALPVAIYDYRWLQPFDLVVSFVSIILTLGIIRRLQGGWKIHWPLVPGQCFDGRRTFSWLNLSLFLLANIFIVLPGVMFYLGGCAGIAVNHFSGGFVSLHPGGIVMQARKYTRDDGKTIVLFPMSHVAEADFYRSVGQTVTTNSVVLLEGVTDTDHLLTNHLSYKRTANFLHLAEQHEDFTPSKRGQFVRADVDIHDFSTNTIALLNLVAQVYSEGLDAHTVTLLMDCAPPPDVEQQMFDDILLKRNAHVLGELYARMPKSDSFIIPWGAMHMVGISRNIEKSGFHLVETRDFVAIRFGGKPANDGGAGWIPRSEKIDGAHRLP